MRNTRILYKCEKSGLKQLMVFTPLAFMLISFLLILMLAMPVHATSLYTGQHSYYLNEVVEISIVNQTTDTAITIKSDTSYYKFLGTPGDKIKFSPKSTGVHIVTAEDAKTGKVLASLSFLVLKSDNESGDMDDAKNPADNHGSVYTPRIPLIDKNSIAGTGGQSGAVPNSSNLPQGQGIFLNKHTYRLGEQAILRVTNRKASRIIISDGMDIFKFLGEIGRAHV